MQQETSTGGQVATAVAVVNKEKNSAVGSIGGIAVGGKMSRPRCKTCNKPLPQMACNDADCDQMRVMCCRSCCIKCGTPCYSGKCARVECPEVYPECECEVSPGCCPDDVACANDACCVNKAKPKTKTALESKEEAGGEEGEGDEENPESPMEGGNRSGGKTVIRTGTIVYAGSEHEGTEEEAFKKIIGHKLYHFLSERTNPRADTEIFVEQECMKDDPEECEMTQEAGNDTRSHKVKRHQQRVEEQESETGDYTEPDSWLTQYVGAPKEKEKETDEEQEQESQEPEHVPITLDFPTKTSPHTKVSGRYECKTFKFTLPPSTSLSEALRSGDGEVRLPLTKVAVDELFGFSKEEYDNGKPKAIYPSSISLVCHTNNTPFHFVPSFVVEAPSIEGQPGTFEEKQFTLAQYGRRFAYYNDRTNKTEKGVSGVAPYHVSLPPTGTVSKQPRGPKILFAQRFHPCMEKLFERWAGLDYRRLFDENVKPVPGRQGVGMFDVSAEKDDDGLYTRSPNAFHYWFTRLDKLKEIARVAGASAKGEGGAGVSNSFSREAKSKNAPVLSDDETAKQLSAMWSPENKSLYVQIEPLWKLWKQQHDKVTKMHGDRDEEKVHPNRFMVFSPSGEEYGATSAASVKARRQVVSYLALRPILGATLDGRVEGWAGPSLSVPPGTSNQISVELEFCFQKCHITGKMNTGGESQIRGEMKEGDKRVQGYMRGNPGSEPGRSYVQGYSIHGGHSVNGHWSSNPGSSPGSHYIAPYNTAVNKQGHHVSGHMSQNQGSTPGAHYIAPYSTAVNKQGHHVSGYTSQNPGATPGTHYVAPYNTAVSKQGHHVDPYSRSVAGPSTDTTRVSGYTTGVDRQGHHVDPHSSSNPGPGSGTHHVVGYQTSVNKQGHHVNEHMAANAGREPGQHHVSGYQTSANKQGHHVGGHLAANAGSVPGKHQVSGYTTGSSKQGHHVAAHSASNPGPGPATHHVGGYTTGITKQGDKRTQGYVHDDD